MVIGVGGPSRAAAQHGGLSCPTVTTVPAFRLLLRRVMDVARTTRSSTFVLP